METEIENGKRIDELETELRGIHRTLQTLVDGLAAGPGVGGAVGGDQTVLMAYLMKSLDQERSERMKMLDRQDPIKLMRGFVEVAAEIRADSSEGIGEVQPNDALKLITAALASRSQRAAGSSEDGGSNGSGPPSDAPESAPNPREG